MTGHGMLYHAKLMLFMAIVTAYQSMVDGGVFKGNVLNSDTQKPIPGAVLELYGVDSTLTLKFSGTTGPDGSFYYDSVPDQRFFLKISATGFPPQWFSPLGTTQFMQYGIWIGPASDFKTILLRTLPQENPPASLLTVSVRDSASLLVSNGIVQLQLEQDLFTVAMADMKNNQGVVTLGNIQPGRYAIFLQCPPYMPQYYDTVINSTSPRYFLTINAYDTIAIAVSLAVQPAGNGEIIGKVMSDTGYLMSGVTVGLYLANNLTSPRYQTMTDAAGIFRFASIVEQSYVIKLENGTSFPQQWFSPQRHATTLYPDDPVYPTPIDDTLYITMSAQPLDNKPAAVLLISVLDSTGAPVSSTTGKIEGTDRLRTAYWQLQYNAVTKQFRIDGVKAGEYSLRFEFPPYPVQYYSPNGMTAQELWFQSIKDKDTILLEAKLRTYFGPVDTTASYAYLSGKVSDSLDQPFPTRVLVIDSTQMIVNSLQTLSDGTFGPIKIFAQKPYFCAIEDPLGKRLYWTPQGMSSIQSFAGKIRAIRNDTVWIYMKVTGIGPIDTVNRVKSFEGVLSALPSYSPVRGARMLAIPSNQIPPMDFNPAYLWSSMVAMTDSTGYYQFQGVPPGDYIVAAIADSQNLVAQFYPSADLPTMAKIIRIDSAYRPTLNMALRPGGQLSGSVKTIPGAPLKGAYVNVHEKNGRRWYEAVTDANGSYRIMGMPAGTWSFWANHPDYLQHDSLPVSNEVIVTEGKTLTYPTILMEPGGRIAGTFTTPVPLFDSMNSGITGQGWFAGNLLLFPDSLLARDSMNFPHYTAGVRFFSTTFNTLSGTFITDICPQGSWRAVFQPMMQQGSNGTAGTFPPVKPGLAWRVVGGDSVLDAGALITIREFDTVKNIALPLQKGFSVSGVLRDSTGTIITNYAVSTMVKTSGRYFCTGFSERTNTSTFYLSGFLHGHDYFLSLWADGYPSQFWTPDTSTAKPFKPYRFDSSAADPLSIMMRQLSKDTTIMPESLPVAISGDYTLTNALKGLSLTIDQRYPFDSCFLYIKVRDSATRRIAAIPVQQGVARYTLTESRSGGGPARYIVIASSQGVKARSNEIYYDPRNAGVAPDSLWIAVYGNRWGIQIEWGAPPQVPNDSISLYRRTTGSPWMLIDRQAAWSTMIKDNIWKREDSGKTFEYRVELLAARKTSRAAPFTLSAAFFSQLSEPLYVGPYEKHRSIQPAIDAAKNGDIIRVRSGLYKESINFKGKALMLESDWQNGKPPVIDAGGGAAITVPWLPLGDERPYVGGFKITNASSGIQTAVPLHVGQCLFSNVIRAFEFIIDSIAMTSAMQSEPFTETKLGATLDQCTFIANRPGSVVAMAGARGIAESPGTVSIPQGYEKSFITPLYSLSSSVWISNSIMANYFSVGGNSELPVKVGGITPSVNVSNCNFWNTASAVFSPRITKENQILSQDPRFIDTIHYFLPDSSPLRTAATDKRVIGYDGRRFQGGETNNNRTGPTPVKGIAVRHLSLEKARISWTASPDSEHVVRHIIYRCPGDTSLFYVNQHQQWQPRLSDSMFMNLVDSFSTTASSFLDTSLTPGVPYLYVVAAIDSAGRQGEVDLPASIPLASLIVNRFDYTVPLKGQRWHMISPWGTDTLALPLSTGMNVFHWDDSRLPDKMLSNYTTSTILAPGIGYWIRPERDTSLSVAQTTLDALAAREAGLSVTLKAGRTGWNQIASPLPFGIAPAWLDSIPAWEWRQDSMGYARAKLLEPWKAYWVHTAKDLTLPVRNDPRSGKRAADGIAWRLQLALRGKNIWDPENFAGVVMRTGEASAKLAEVLEPPAGFSGSQLYFLSNDGVTRYSSLFTEGATSDEKRMMWRIAVSPSSTEAGVTVLGRQTIPASRFAFWIDNSRVIDLRKDSVIAIGAHEREAYAFLMVTADKNDIALYTGKLTLNPAWPNPFGRSVVLSYVVPYDWQENGMRTSGESRPVRIAMYDIRGKKIRTLVNGRQTIGVHRVTWKGDDDGGISVRSGMYIVRMSGGKQYATKRIFKIQ